MSVDTVWVVDWAPPVGSRANTSAYAADHERLETGAPPRIALDLRDCVDLGDEAPELLGRSPRVERDGVLDTGRAPLVIETGSSQDRRSPSVATFLDEEAAQRYLVAIDALPGLPTAEEALALVGILPPDDSTSLGLAWSILHAIEASPAWPVWTALDDRTWWISYLRKRCERGGLQSPESTA